MKKNNPLLNTKLDDANFLLLKGYASREHAQEYLERWNTGGKRLTRLQMRERVICINGCGPFLCNYLIQTND